LREIELTRGLIALVDDEDFEKLNAVCWNANVNRGAISERCYAKRYSLNSEGKPRRQMFMHRLIMGAEAGEEVRHINGDGLDNRRSNLKIATHSEILRARGAEPTVVLSGRVSREVSIALTRVLASAGAELSDWLCAVAEREIAESKS
jgi:hypothetical protein